MGYRGSARASSGSWSPATLVVSVSASQIFPKPSPKPARKAGRQVKRRAKEPEPASDHEYVPPTSTAFEGLEEDEDDTAEQAAALLSPVKASTAARSSKVSIYTLS